MLRDYVTRAILAAAPSAVVSSRQWDGGVFFEVRLNGRTARLSAEWGDNPESIAAVLMTRLGLTVPESVK